VNCIESIIPKHDHDLFKLHQGCKCWFWDFQEDSYCMRFKSMIWGVSWNYDVYMFNYDVKVKLWSQLYLPDYDYDVMKWYDVWKFISHIMMMFMKNYDLSERSILTLWC